MKYKNVGWDTGHAVTQAPDWCVLSHLLRMEADGEYGYFHQCPHVSLYSTLIVVISTCREEGDKGKAYNWSN